MWYFKEKREKRYRVIKCYINEDFNSLKKIYYLIIILRI